MELKSNVMNSELKSTVEYLREARDILIEEGWTQGAYVTPRGYCAVGACSHVSPARYASPITTSIIMPLWEALAAEGIDYIFEWNDAPGRTKEEVIDLFDRAIANVLEAEIVNG